MEENLGLKGRVRYVEELGSTLEELLCNPDPVGGHCGRTKCFPCRSKEGTCHKQGIVYEIECSHCKIEGRKVQYIGESARNGYDRGAEHMANLNSENHS